MIFTSQQHGAIKAVNKWITDFKSNRSSTKQVFYLAGYAGTGKTTLAKEFANSIVGNVLYAAYTGKAALMMRNNGCEGASTIHSLIYKAEEDNDGGVTFKINNGSSLRGAALLIIDECSMVDKELAEDVLAFGVPVLVLGDPAQLPPVSGAGYFTEVEPDVMLTEIHRQAKDNPIVYLATIVREGGKLQPGSYGDSIIASTIETTDELITYSQVIVGRNTTRSLLNNTIRGMINHDSVLPITDDRLICLKNDRKTGILNGEMFTVQEAITGKAMSSYHRYKIIDVDTSEKSIVTKIHDSFFDGTAKPDWKLLKGTQEFDYGYAITAHKSQGSQWNDVLIFDESWCFRNDSNRWLYTAITRAQSKILVYQT